MTDIRTISANANLTKMDKLLIELKRDLPVHLESQKIQAKVLWAKYEALLNEGFNPAQALELTRDDS